MFNKVALLILVVAVAAAEGRARGAKLGPRRTRQNSVWGRPRQDPSYPQTPAAGYPSPQQTVGGAPSPSPVPSGGYAPQTAAPTVVAGVPPVEPSVCKYPGFFATPGSCVNFYRCVDWSGAGTYYTVFQFNCPAGTIFDDDLDICNHIAWTVPKRPECADMLQGSLVPLGSAPVDGAGSSSAGPQTGLVPVGGSYPQPGGGSGTVSSNPDAPPRPFSLECYDDDVYRRHPIYCNRYYKCTWDGSDWVFPMLTCPQDLLFNEAGQQCADQSSVSCDGKIAPYTSPEMVSSTEATTDATDETAPTAPPPLEPSFECPAAGYYPFEGDCIRFYKCVQLEDTQSFKSLLYKCPGGYGYSEAKKRCDKNERLPTCSKVPLAAHFRLAPARELSVDDLLWFFSN